MHLVSQLNSVSAKLECLWSRRDFPVHDWFSEFFISLKGGGVVNYNFLYLGGRGVKAVYGLIRQKRKVIFGGSEDHFKQFLPLMSSCFPVRTIV